MPPKEKKTIQRKLLGFFKKSEDVEENKIKKNPSLLNLIPSLVSKKFTSREKDSLIIDTTAAMNSIPVTAEIVSPTRTLRESEGRRMSGMDQYDYPSKKSTDGKTLYQKSLPRPQSMSSTQCVS
jgi:hypothetical protein